MNARKGQALLLFAVLGACAAAPLPVREPQPREAASAEIGQVLDNFHAAAAKADEEAYFAAFARDGVFLGTDASERWDVAAFRAYAHPHFAAGKGWTCLPRGRHIVLHAAGESAWFDELLDHTKYGELRGSGVLVRENGAWKIAQYNLTFTIPNAKASDVITVLKAASPVPAPG